MLAVLAVIPVQEEERKRAHDQEEQDPHPEASVVFDGLATEVNKRTFYRSNLLTSTKKNPISYSMNSTCRLDVLVVSI